MRFVNDWRSGKTTLKDAVSRNKGQSTPPRTEQEVEKQFLNKVDRELALPEYSIFSAYRHSQ